MTGRSPLTACCPGFAAAVHDGPDTGGGTTVDVEHRITSLSAEANDGVQQFADTFEHYFDWWQRSISGLLEAGASRSTRGPGH